MISGLRRVFTALTSPLRAKQAVAPLNDWNFSPCIHPMEASHGTGGHLVDQQGRDYLDFSSAWGANLLGYGYPAVTEAITRQAQRFAGVGMPYPEFWELGRRLCEVIPCADLVRYGKNGSDATMGAVRLARAVTRREVVLHRGYHGFHDWWMASTGCQGIPEALRSTILTLPALTPELVEDAFRQHPGRIACLILDPMAPPVAEAVAIREIMAITRRNGALVIFDEVVSGFRVAPGGMQELWGITPDLACFGKSIANGLPLSVLAGRQEFMQHLPAVNYGMTFEGEAISIAAANATLREVLERKVCEALAEKGRLLKREYARLAEQHGVLTRLGGPDARPHLEFAAQGGVAERELRWLAIQEMARRDVLTIGTFNLCFSHDERDLQAAVGAFECALKAVRQAMDEGSAARLLDSRLYQSMQ